MCDLKRICFIGNLWSVTDKDSDNITTDVVKRLDEIAQAGSLELLTKVITDARK